MDIFEYSVAVGLHARQSRPFHWNMNSTIRTEAFSRDTSVKRWSKSLINQAPKQPPGTLPPQSLPKKSH